MRFRNALPQESQQLQDQMMGDIQAPPVTCAELNGIAPMMQMNQMPMNQMPMAQMNIMPAMQPKMEMPLKMEKQPKMTPYMMGQPVMPPMGVMGQQGMMQQMPMGQQLTPSQQVMPPLPTGFPTGPTTTPLLPSPGGLPAAPVGEQAPTTVQSPMYTPGWLRTQIGKRMRVEFLIGTNGPLVDRIGTLVGVGASYILLRPIDSDDLLMCDIYSIKFVTVYY